LILSHSDFVNIGNKITQPNHLALRNPQSDSSCHGGKFSKVVPFQIVFSNLVNIHASERIVGVVKNGKLFQFPFLEQKRFAWEHHYGLKSTFSLNSH